MQNMKPQNFFDIPPGAIVPGSLPKFKIYIKSQDGRLILWTNNGNEVMPEQIGRLTATGLKKVFIDLDEAILFDDYVENNLCYILSSETTSDDDKASLFSKVSINVVKNVLETSLKSGKIQTNSLERTELMIKNTLEFVSKSGSLRALTKIIGHDYQTYEHATKVFWLTMVFLKQNPDLLEEVSPGYDSADDNLKKQILQQCGVAALLHDIGKVFISPEIINKNSILTDDERNAVKSHPLYGLAMLLDTDLPVFVKKGILEHHEDYEGGGYPMGIDGLNICALGRILRIIDVFDAMTSHRPYKKAFSPLKAVQIMVGNHQEERNKTDARDLSMKKCFDEKFLKKFIVLLGI